MIGNSVLEKLERKQSKLINLGLEIKQCVEQFLFHVSFSDDQIYHAHKADKLKKLCDTYNDILFSKDGE